MSDLAHTRLIEAERAIAAGLATFVEVGNALMRIRNERLYADDYATFEDYCRTRWGFSRQRAHQMIEAAEITEALSTIVDAAPSNEAQARALTGLDPEVAAEVMEAAADAGPVTAASIRDARAAVTGQPTKPAEWVCQCGAHFKSEHTHCPTCDAHYPAPAHCPEHTISVDAETGEVLNDQPEPLPEVPSQATADAADDFYRLAKAADLIKRHADRMADGYDAADHLERNTWAGIARSLRDQSQALVDRLTATPALRRVK